MTNKEEQSKTSFSDGDRFFILGEFNDDMNRELVLPLTKKIDSLSAIRNPSIEIIIDSNGGNGNTLMHLVDLVETAKKNGITVKTIVRNRAYSSGSMLAITGSKGHRYIAPAAEHLIHYGSVNGWYNHTPTQLDRESKFFKRWFATLVDHYKKYADVPDLEEHIKDDNFFIDAKSSIKWGLADKLSTEL